MCFSLPTIIRTHHSAHFWGLAASIVGRGRPSCNFPTSADFMLILC